MDDDELFAAVAAGDDSALRELFSRRAPWLAARMRSLLRAADIEDVRQEGRASADVDLSRVWAGVAAQVWRRRPGPLERLAGRLLRSPGLARALVATPSLLLAWVIATVVVLAAGMAATLGTGMPYVALLAPVVAGTGIAYAYGPGIDPAWELSRSLAVSDGFNLVLLPEQAAHIVAHIGIVIGEQNPILAGCNGGDVEAQILR